MTSRYAALFLLLCLTACQTPLERLKNKDYKVRDQYNPQAEALYEKGEELFSQGKTDLALQHAEKALDYSPDYSRAYLLKARIAEVKGQVHLQEKYLSTAYLLNPKDKILTLELFNVFLSQGKVYEADRIAREMAYLYGRSDVYSLMRARLAFKTKDYSSAIRRLKAMQDGGLFNRKSKDTLAIFDTWWLLPLYESEAGQHADAVSSALKLEQALAEKPLSRSNWITIDTDLMAVRSDQVEARVQAFRQKELFYAWLEARKNDNQRIMERYQISLQSFPDSVLTELVQLGNESWESPDGIMDKRWDYFISNYQASPEVPLVYAYASIEQKNIETSVKALSVLRKHAGFRRDWLKLSQKLYQLSSDKVLEKELLENHFNNVQFEPRYLNLLLDLGHYERAKEIALLQDGNLASLSPEQKKLADWEKRFRLMSQETDVYSNWLSEVKTNRGNDLLTYYSLKKLKQKKQYSIFFQLYLRLTEENNNNYFHDKLALKTFEKAGFDLQKPGDLRLLKTIRPHRAKIYSELARWETLKNDDIMETPLKRYKLFQKSLKIAWMDPELSQEKKDFVERSLKLSLVEAERVFQREKAVFDKVQTNDNSWLKNSTNIAKWRDRAVLHYGLLLDILLEKHQFVSDIPVADRDKLLKYGNLIKSLGHQSLTPKYLFEQEEFLSLREQWESLKQRRQVQAGEAELLLRRFPEHYYFYEEAVRLHIRAKDGPRSWELLNQAFRFFPESRDLQLLIVDHYLAFKSDPLARDRLKRLAVQNQWKLNDFKRILEQMYRAAMFHEVLSISKRFPSQFQGDNHLTELKAKSLYQTGQIRASVSIWQKLLYREPQNYRHYYHLSLAYLSLGQYSRSLEYIQRAVFFNEASSENYYLQALLYMKTGENDKAARLIEEQLSRNEGDPFFLYARGQYFESLLREKDKIDVPRYINRAKKAYLETQENSQFFNLPFIWAESRLTELNSLILPKKRWRLDSALSTEVFVYKQGQQFVSVYCMQSGRCEKRSLPDGEVLWKIDFPSVVTSRPFLFDNKLWFFLENGALEALEPSKGKRIYSLSVGEYLADSIYPYDVGAFLFANKSGEIVKLKNGIIEERFYPGAKVSTSLLVYRGTIYGGFSDHSFKVIDLFTGKIIASLPLAGMPSGKIIHRDNTLLMAADDLLYYTLDMQALPPKVLRLYRNDYPAVVENKKIEDYSAVLNTEGELRLYGIDGQFYWQQRLNARPETGLRYQNGILSVIQEKSRLSYFRLSDGKELLDTRLPYDTSFNPVFLGKDYLFLAYDVGLLEVALLNWQVIQQNMGDEILP